MTSNPDYTGPLQPLSIGNVVSAALRLYNSHLRQYFGLAFKAYLWLLIPIYGWAKFSALSALISRLAFGDLVSQPESIRAAHSQVNPRMWRIWAVGLLVGLILFGVVFALAIPIGIIIAVLGVIVSALEGNAIVVVLAILFGLIGFIAFIFGWIWFYSRLAIAEVPIAIEENMGVTATIGRSWNLTQGSVWRLQGIILVAFLVTLPVQIIFQLLVNIIQILAAVVVPSDSILAALFGVLSFVLLLGFSFLGGAIILPFWQALKAVVYFDLRTRREGLGLQLRSPNTP